jgi:hypothetical protein
MSIHSHFYRDSSFINHISWDSDFLNLAVRFASGTVWIYYGVPQEIYKSLITAKSVGAYFNKNVRDNYPSERYSYSSEVNNLVEEKKDS